MFRRCRSRSREHGSLPLALLVAIIVGGIIVVLVARTLTAQNQVRFDQTYHGALPAADAGVQLAQHQLNEPGMEFTAESGTYARQDFPVDERTVPQTGVLDGREFTWTLERIDDLIWEVDSESLDPRTDVGRRVNVQFRDQPLLGIAAFTEDLFAMSGSNTADSYNSETGAWCTGQGFVASNEDVVFSGNASGDCQTHNQRTVDQVHLYDWEDNEGANWSETNPGGMRCRQGNNNMDHPNCREAGDYPAPLTIDERKEFATDEAIAFIEDALNACEAADGPLLDYSSSDDGAELSPAPNAAAAMAAEDFALADGHYCYDNLDFDEDTTLQGASRTNPVIIFVRNEVTLRRSQGQPRVDVGCGDEPCVPLSGAPEAGRLWIFVLNGDVLLSNQSNFAGVMWAPRATCKGHPSNAQVDIFGSVICDNITNAGGWRYHYDETLNEVTSGDHVPIAWEELATTNS